MAKGNEKNPNNLPADSVSSADFFTVFQQISQGLYLWANSYLNVNGQANLAGFTTPMQVKNQPGRLATVVVLTAGSSPGMAYDSASATPTKPLYQIPNTVGFYPVNLPTNIGLYVVPGTGQQLTVAFA